MGSKTKIENRQEKTWQTTEENRESLDLAVAAHILNFSLFPP
jgi:hypothetical protein